MKRHSQRTWSAWYIGGAPRRSIANLPVPTLRLKPLRCEGGNNVHLLQIASELNSRPKAYVNQSVTPTLPSGVSAPASVRELIVLNPLGCSGDQGDQHKACGARLHFRGALSMSGLHPLLACSGQALACWLLDTAFRTGSMQRHLLTFAHAEAHCTDGNA